MQGFAGFDCWIDQSGLKSVLLDWIVIDNPISKSGFGFGLSIQQFHYNPNPKKPDSFIFYQENWIRFNFKAKPILLIALKSLYVVWGGEMVPGDLAFSRNNLSTWQKHNFSLDCDWIWIGFGLDLDWIWIGLSFHFEKWIWIWIDNHKFSKDLDWIDNPK